MLADLLKDYNTVQVIEWLILHERLPQGIWKISEDIGIIAADLKPILIHLLNYKIIYFDSYYNSIGINQESKLLPALRLLIRDFGLYGDKECQIQLCKS